VPALLDPRGNAIDLERIFREESGKVVATLVRPLGDHPIPEERGQAAFVVTT